MRRDKKLRFHRLYFFQCLQVRGHIIDKSDLIFIQRLPGGQTVRQIDHVVGRPESRHIEEMSRQRNQLESLRQHFPGQRLCLAFLSQQKLMPEIFARISAIQKSRLQDRMIGKITFDPGRIDPASRLPLQILVASDMVRIGMRIVDRTQFPSVRVQDLAHLSSRILVASAVNEAYLRIIQFYQSDLRRTLNIIIVF